MSTTKYYNLALLLTIEQVDQVILNLESTFEQFYNKQSDFYYYKTAAKHTAKQLNFSTPDQIQDCIDIAEEFWINHPTF